MNKHSSPWSNLLWLAVPVIGTVAGKVFMALLKALALLTGHLFLQPMA
jgi:hypothetical protein